MLSPFHYTTENGRPPVPGVALQLVVVALQTLNGGLQRNNCCTLLHEYATKETASDAASETLLHKRACALQHWQRMVQQAVQHATIDARMVQQAVQHGATGCNTPERTQTCPPSYGFLNTHTS